LRLGLKTPSSVHTPKHVSKVRHKVVVVFTWATTHEVFVAKLPGQACGGCFLDMCEKVFLAKQSGQGQVFYSYCMLLETDVIHCFFSFFLLCSFFM
jgi:hypothetical protein